MICSHVAARGAAQSREVHRQPRRSPLVWLRAPLAKAGPTRAQGGGGAKRAPEQLQPATDNAASCGLEPHRKTPTRIDLFRSTHVFPRLFASFVWKVHLLLGEGQLAPSLADASLSKSHRARRAAAAYPRSCCGTSAPIAAPDRPAPGRLPGPPPRVPAEQSEAQTSLATRTHRRWAVWPRGKRR